MRILYINHDLLRFDSEAGVWGREVVRELRSAGAEVVSLQDLDNGRPTPATPGRGLLAGVKTMVKQRAPQHITLKLVEYYLQARGLICTLRVSW